MAKKKIFIIEKLMYLIGILGCLAIPYVIFGGLFGFLETSHFFICVVLFVCVFFIDKWRIKLIEKWVTEGEILEWREKRNEEINGRPFGTNLITFTNGIPSVLTYSNMQIANKKMETMVLANQDFLFLIFECDTQNAFHNKIKDNNYIAHVIPIANVKKFYIDGNVDVSYETTHNSITNAYDTKTKTKDNRRLIMIAEDLDEGLVYTYEFDIKCTNDFRPLFYDIM